MLYFVPKKISPRMSSTQSLLQLQDAFDNMKREMSAFTCALNSTTEDVEYFRKELSDMKKELKDLDKYKAEVVDLRAEVLELRHELDAREQQKYLKDVELTGITEHQGENLTQIVNNISAKLGISLEPHDVDDIKRVGQRTTGSDSRPRPVIVTLTRRAPRDQLLRAARVRRGLTTDMIQVPGNSRRIYVNEHLTKSNRVLFSKARASGLQLKFKYVWTSNGTVFMRRTETSSVLRVTSETILEKLMNRHVNNNNTRINSQYS
ncbi:uncharacterized protein LOC115447666 [Manduca sexta]|uniref:FP protein C-terminal domain-containing protein n=1 Tax=Manduca sexta TaxID=7130 RepID=A0A921ZFT0_MANSE|nr:uncharacterized protein LOC115447666 [Manduca sexta]XP_037298412.1 uncharacterized protein LOC115447666 [Manduca sexta]KAG6456656.1 hypothetical protein O3G_MSEX009857 [Manduca sexta]